jgi:hypothetical protein
MKAFLVDPVENKITEVDYDGDYKSIKTLIEADLFDVVRINVEGDCFFVDDEGLYSNKPFWAYQNFPHPLAGKSLVLGTDHVGESISPMIITLEHLQRNIAWISSGEALVMAEMADEAAESQRAEHESKGIGFVTVSAADIIKDRE